MLPFLLYNHVSIKIKEYRAPNRKYLQNEKSKIFNIFCKCWQRPISTIYTTYFYMNKQDHHKRYSDYKLTPLLGFGHQSLVSETVNVIS